MTMLCPICGYAYDSKMVELKQLEGMQVKCRMCGSILPEVFKPTPVKLEDSVEEVEREPLAE